jgi:hypothetical protein
MLSTTVDGNTKAMTKKQTITSIRRIRKYRSPWIVAWFSAAFPGCGHIYMGDYIQGYIMVVWEIYINFHANINLAIFYSFTGRFEIAKQVLDRRWAILYVLIFVFCIWDSYRRCVEANMHGRDIENIAVPADFYEPRKSIIAMAWSFLMPGLGHLYLYRFATGLFIMSVWLPIVYFSRFLEGIHLSFIGEFARAIAILDPKWLLYMPSIYGYIIFDALNSTDEVNSSFETSQAQYLQDKYQDPDFQMPVLGQ